MATMHDAWAVPRTVEHTFTTGRTATIRVALPTSQLVRDGVWDSELDAALNAAISGDLDDPTLAVRLFDAVVMGMFVDPRIVPDDAVDVAARCFPMSVLDESEIEETLAAAFGGPAAAATFPGHSTNEPDQRGGSGVQGVAVESAGDGAGKPRSTRRRPASGGTTKRRSSAA